MRRILHRLRALFRREKLDAEMAEEMRLHLEMQAEKFRAAGMGEEEARYAARRKFGGVEQIKEQCRDQRQCVWLEQLGQDLRFGFRGLAKTPGFTAVATLTLALGIGTTTSFFSVVYGVLLEPYPYARSGEIWAPEVVDPRTNRYSGFRISDYLEIAKLPGVASAMATGFNQVTLSGGVNPEILTAPLMSDTAFAFLDVPPILGRGLTAADIEPNGTPRPVTVLSFKLWQRLFNGDPAALGKTLVLNDQPHVVIGVMPPRFGWYNNDGLWLPLSTLDENRGVRPIVRFKPGISKEVATQQLVEAMQEQARREPARFPPDGFIARFQNYLNVTVASGQMRTSLILLLGAVGFLLLIVCTNVANLQLARGVGRNREMAVRLALGAGRGRLVRQLLTESIVLSLAGGVLGIVLAYELLRVIVLLLPDNYVPNEARIEMNGWVLAFSAALAVLTGILSGLVPGWQCTRPDVNESLKDGQGAAGGGPRGNRTRNTLVVVEVALSVMLLVGAALSVRGFIKLQNFEPGFQTARMLLLQVPLDPKRYTSFDQRNGFFRDFLVRIRTLPGVANASVGVPPGFDTGSGATIPGQPKPSDGVALNYIDSEFLNTLGIGLRAGRNLTPGEVARGEHVALVSEAAAKLWLNGESPLGRTVALDALLGGGPGYLPQPNATKDVTIVGIIADTRGRGPTQPPPAAVLVPYTLRGAANRAMMVRTEIEPTTLLNSVRGELRALDPEQPMQRPITVAEIDDQKIAQPRFNLSLLGGLAGIALILAAAGIYSVLSYAVAQRTREIGLRMALGADGRSVLRLFLGLGGRLLAIGVVVGLAGSVVLARVVGSQLFNGPVFDPLAFVIAVGLLSIAALLACYVPARRATKVDPMVALRAD